MSVVGVPINPQPVGPLRLNLGSGPDRFEGWTNVDYEESVHPDILADAEHLPLEDESVQEIWASHVLEHLPCNNGALAEWHRVLMPGGIITVAVPEVMSAFALYSAERYTLEYLNATVFGMEQMGENSHRYTHRQVFFPGMLERFMRPYFPDAHPVANSHIRQSLVGEEMVEGHKPGGATALEDRIKIEYLDEMLEEAAKLRPPEFATREVYFDHLTRIVLERKDEHR